MNLEPKKNCWEVMGCAYGPSSRGTKTCPVVTETRLHNIHGGINAGRACWVVAGTLCHDEAGKRFASKMETCFECSFYRRIHMEEPEVKSHQELLLRSKQEV